MLVTKVKRNGNAQVSKQQMYNVNIINLSIKLARPVVYLLFILNHKKEIRKSTAINKQQQTTTLAVFIININD